MLTEDFKVDVCTYICLNSLEFMFVSHGYKVIKHTCFRVCIFYYVSINYASVLVPSEKQTTMYR